MVLRIIYLTKEIDSVLAYIKSFWPKEEYEFQINLNK